MDPIRILIADDDAGMRLVMRRLAEQAEGYELVGEATDGAVSLTSQKGVGTELRYSFSATHIDLPPMGDLAETVLMLFNYPGDFDLAFTHRKGTEEYTISRLELADAVGGLESIEGISLAREFLQSQEDALA